MSGSVKDGKPEEREATLREPRRAPTVSRPITAPLRPANQHLFELDAPSTSGAHALGLQPLTAAEIKIEQPANDVLEPSIVPGSVPAPQPSSDLERESADVDAEFAALTNTAELEAQLTAASMVPHDLDPQRFDTRALTNVAPTENFETTLRLPRPKDTLDARRGRLGVRYKSACVAFKQLSDFEISASARKELVELFSGYEASLRAALPPTANGEKRDSDHLHNSLPAPGFDEHERALTRVEDRLLALDDTIAEHEFHARVTREKHPPKVLLRYARVLACRRFNVGYRRDRFEYLAVQLLANGGPDERLQLLPRDQAGPVLHHLLAGLPQVAAIEERAPAVEHMREALDRLREIDGPRPFFESEFYLDLHGYKVSMRDHVTCAEFLYLCAAMHVELHNRLIAWSRTGTPSLAALRSQLLSQQRAAEEVFTNFRRPRSTPVPKSSPRPAAPKETLPHSVPARREKRKRRKRGELVEQGLGARTWLKLVGLSLAIVLSGGWLLYSLDVFQVVTPPTTLSSAQLQVISPLLLRATVSSRQHRLDGLVSRNAWQQLSKNERRAFATDLAAKLKRQNIPNARVMGYKSPVITIEFSTVVFVDDAS